jgi:hypothetical protein
VKDLIPKKTGMKLVEKSLGFAASGLSTEPFSEKRILSVTF